jgi:excisionase family DNA binding protein
MEKELQEIKRLVLLNAKTTLGVDDVALMLGVSKQTVYRLVSSGRITHYKSKGMKGEIGKMVYFRREDVEDYCFAVKKASEAEINDVVSQIRG